MTLKIISAEDILFQGEVKAVHLPGVQGAFTVLRNHASLISALNPGRVSYELPDGMTDGVDISGGIVDVDRNIVAVCIF